MRFNLPSPFTHRIRPFLTLCLFTLSMIALSASWPVEAESNPSFDGQAAVHNLPDQLAGYDLFTTKSQDGWAYLTFVKWGEQSQIAAFQIALGRYDEPGQTWRVYAEGTAEYINALPHLPAWLQWLAHLEAQRPRHPQGSQNGTYTIPGLPWKPDTTWRYNQGPQTAGHQYAFDFGVPIIGVEDKVYAAEDGVVIGTNGTCIIIERPSDGLRHFYQHINSSDLYQFSFGEPISYKQYIGRTTIAPGCGGTTTGHHLHFAFYTPFGGPIIDPQGFIMNGWQVVGNTLVKGDQTATPNTNDPILHDATTFYDDFTYDWLSPEWSWVREDDTNWSLEERPNFLRLHTQNGGLQDNILLPPNLLLRRAPTINYELITRFEGAFTENFHQALLILYADDDNYLALSRLYDDINFGGDVYVFWQEENGELVEPLFSAAALEPATELRLLVTNTFVMALYLDENGEWAALGQTAIDGVNLYPTAGISAYHGVGPLPVSSSLIDFDFVMGRPIEPGTTYLPFVISGS